MCSQLDLVDALPLNLARLEILLDDSVIHVLWLEIRLLRLLFATTCQSLIFSDEQRRGLLPLEFGWQQTLRFFPLWLVPDHVELVLHQDWLIKLITLQNFDHLGVHIL